MKICYLILLFFLAVSVFAEQRKWNTLSGKTITAEYVTVMGKKVILKTKTNQVIRLPFAKLSKQDQEYIELKNPPRLKIQLSKTTKQRIFPQNIYEDERPKAQYATFFVKIKQISTHNYPHKMTAEYFAIGKEINGSKKILLGRGKYTFKLNGYGSTFSRQGITFELPKYHLKVKNAKRAEDEEWLPFRGIRYSGYIIVVKDKTGKIIAYKTTSKRYFLYLKNLQKLYQGVFFDPKTGKRTTPTRPPHFPVLYQ